MLSITAKARLTCPFTSVYVLVMKYMYIRSHLVTLSRAVGLKDSANDAMAAANLKSIYDDMDYYFETFEVFKKAVNLDYIMEQWHKQWPVIIDSIDFEPSGDEAFRMMTVGSGEGDVESNIFPYILKRHPKLHVCVIEPSPESVALFKKKASKLQETHPGVTFEWHVKTLEQYQDEEASDRFHLVLSGHSLYYIEKWGAAVNTMYGFVRKGGNLVITICNGESPAGRLFEKLNELGSEMHSLLSTQIKGHLAKEGNENKSYPRVLPINIDAVFDDKSKEGNMLLDFLCHRAHIRQTAPSSVFAEVMSFIDNNLVVDENGVKWFHADEEELVIKKV